MGTHSYEEKCIKCGAEDTLIITHDTKTLQSEGDCYNCGYTFYPIVKEDQKSLIELNELREDLDLKPLKKLPKIDLN